VLPSSWDIYGPRWLRLNVGMTELTRRLLNNEHPESWGIFDGDVQVGGICAVRGTGGQMIWQWSCGFYPGCDKSQQTAGNADTYHEAKAAFQAAWERLRPQITPAMRDEWRKQQAWTAWKYTMWDTKCRMPTQSTTGRARCFCGTEITTAGIPEHVYAAHMENA